MVREREQASSQAGPSRWQEMESPARAMLPERLTVREGFTRGPEPLATATGSEQPSGGDRLSTREQLQAQASEHGKNLDTLQIQMKELDDRIGKANSYQDLLRQGQDVEQELRVIETFYNRCDIDSDLLHNLARDWRVKGYELPYDVTIWAMQGGRVPVNSGIHAQFKEEIGRTFGPVLKKKEELQNKLGEAHEDVQRLGELQQEKGALERQYRELELDHQKLRDILKDRGVGSVKKWFQKKFKP
jgi:predicted nuclease with TOPRIM domain